MLSTKPFRQEQREREEEGGKLSKNKTPSPFAPAPTPQFDGLPSDVNLEQLTSMGFGAFWSMCWVSVQFSTT